MRWLCRRLDRNSVIIMDNAPYHSRKLDAPPTKSASYGTMIAFCEMNGIDFPIERATKSLKVISVSMC